MLNAMVAGFVRPGRLLLMSDRLLDDLPRGQRLMVVMHELAHVKRWHVPLRMAAILPAWFVSAHGSEWLIQSGWFAETIGGAIGAAFGLVTTVISLGAVSHFCELDADATACRLAVRACRRSGDRDQDPEFEMTSAMAADLMADALLRVTADHPSSRKMSWLHPSLSTRVGRLRRVAAPHSDSTYPLPDSPAEGHTWTPEGSA
jgi:Zn-dependent protease with chaperone function